MLKLFYCELFSILVLLVLPASIPRNQNFKADELTALKLANSITCTPDRETLSKLIDESEIYLLPGSGNYKWKINTDSDSAQLYFNQGINTYYGFHIIESLASFKKAAQFDAANPMVWWAQALAYGPNINDVGYSASPEALSAIHKADSLSANATEIEKALIRAMSVRYSEDTTISRENLNQRYSDAMAAIYASHPSSADVAALYADAMMLQHPWDLWHVNGTPKPWTPRIQEVLEAGLKLDAKHPGINHYYIHVIEPSPTPSKALASADILGSITPGLAHLVHMPSHIYLRTGQFNKGAAINQDAVKQFQNYQTLYPGVSGGAFIYDWHNRHMLVNCAMHAGRYKTAIDAANELASGIDSASLASAAPVGALVQYIYMAPVLIHVRFEKWDSLLSMKPVSSNFTYASLLQAFGRGMAYAGKNNLIAARNEANRIDELMKNEELKIEMKPFSAAIEGAKTAKELLSGFIYLKEKKFDEAISHFKVAAETERQMVYNEPRDWFLNPHAYLGDAYYQAGKMGAAEKAFLQDLAVNANNVWSLRGLYKTQMKQKKNKQAAITKKQLQEAATEADTDLLTLH